MLRQVKRDAPMTHPNRQRVRYRPYVMPLARGNPMAKKPGRTPFTPEIAQPKKASSLTLVDVAKIAGVSPLRFPARFTDRSL